MTKISWDKFRIKNENYTQAFEELCYHLFCRKYSRPDGIKVDYNHVGLEAEPIVDGKRQLVGFQAKFFSNPLSSKSSIIQITDSIKKAKAVYPKLKKIIVYTHQSFGNGKGGPPKYKTDIETAAHPIKIEWFVSSNFLAALAIPGNFDLARLYFDSSDEVGFLSASIAPKRLTFLSSVQCLDLNTTLRDGTLGSTADIVSSPIKQHILVGSPGSGKSICLQQLYRRLSGLDKSDLAAMKSHLAKQKAIPMLINLRDCAVIGLEELIRDRQREYNVDLKGYKLIYLFDGIDELSEQKLDLVLPYILDLVGKANTERVIFSSRLGSLNRLKVRGFFPDVEELTIAPLLPPQIDHFFNVKGESQKLLLLKNLRAGNPTLIDEIKDILLLELLWQTVADLGPDSKISDLIERQVEHLILQPEHRKYLGNLNVLYPKATAILQLQEDISFAFHNKFQFRFRISELQKLILEKFDRLDYESVNNLVEYLAQLFFDQMEVKEREVSFIYRHRRYQEYFFAIKLRKEYERDPLILRRLNVLTNKEFFENLFLPMLRKQYSQQQNLIETTALNLIDVYLGKNMGWGADLANYWQSSYFPTAIAIQQPEVIEELIFDPNLGLIQKILLGVEELKKLEILTAKPDSKKDRYKVDQLVRGIWEQQVAKLINLRAVLYKYQKPKIANKVDDTIQLIVKQFEDKKMGPFAPKVKGQMPLSDPRMESAESFFYQCIVVKHESLKSVYNEYLDYEPRSVDIDADDLDRGAGKQYRAFFKVALEFCLGELVAFIPETEEHAFILLISLLNEPQYVDRYFSNREFALVLSKRFEKMADGANARNINILFYRKVNSLSLTEDELKFAESVRKKVAQYSDRNLRFNRGLHVFTISSMVNKDFTFDRFLADEKRHDYFREVTLYVCLYQDFVSMLAGKMTLEQVVGRFTRYVNRFTRPTDEMLLFGSELGALWAYIVGRSNAEWERKLNAKSIVFQSGRIEKIAFGIISLEIAPDEQPLLSSSDLIQVESALKVDGDYFHFADRCFQLAMLNSKVNKQNAIEFISKGIGNSILRHGWRKDILVCDEMVEALEILWRNDWPSRDQLRKLTKEVFKLTLKVIRITDRDHTEWGPYNLVDVIVEYDIDLAEKFAKKIKKEEGQYDLRLDKLLIVGKIKMGYPVNIVLEEITDVPIHYDHHTRPSSQYHLTRFRCYLTIASSLFYSEVDRLNGFNLAYKEIDDMLSYSDYYIDWNNDVRTEREQFMQLCLRYEKECKIPQPDQELISKEVPMYIGDYRLGINKLRSETDLKKWYEQVFARHKETLITNFTDWKLIVDRTFQLNGNILPLIEVLKRDSYPQYDYFHKGSRYYHFAVAAALENVNTRSEMREYLHDHTGHGGFKNLMKCFEVLRDEEMCLQLFNRFFSIAKLLVY